MQPVVEGDSYRFEVRTGKPPEGAKNGTKLARCSLRCLMSDAPIEPKHIYAEANAGRDGCQARWLSWPKAHAGVFISRRRQSKKPLPSKHNRNGSRKRPCSDNPRWFSPPLYGLKTYGYLFTPRQLVALTTFSDLVPEAIARIRADALAAGMADDGRGLDAGGNGATAYAEAVGVYLGFANNKVANIWVV